MGKQSSRIYFQGKDHKDIWFNNRYSSAMMLKNEIVWKKINKWNGVFSGAVSFFGNYIEKKGYRFIDYLPISWPEYQPLKNGMAYFYECDNNMIISFSNDMSILNELYKRPINDTELIYNYTTGIINDDTICGQIRRNEIVSGKLKKDVIIFLYSFSENKYIEYLLENSEIDNAYFNRELYNFSDKYLCSIKKTNGDYEYIMADMEGYTSIKRLENENYIIRGNPFLYYDNKFYFVRRTAISDETSPTKARYIYQLCYFNKEVEENTVCLIKNSTSHYHVTESSLSLFRDITRLNENTYIFNDCIINFENNKSLATVSDFSGFNFLINKYKGKEKVGEITISITQENINLNLMWSPYLIENNKINRNCMVGNYTEIDEEKNYSNYIVLIRDLFESENNCAIYYPNE